ncbi:HAD family hydrolase, partial [Anaerosporobacter sp.]|uniref:HAD family hydrolase n=1 Tax=Anaerosporobacter sp. TaxID=1872529 RepID=UPI00286F9C39
KIFTILQNCGFCLNKTPRYIEITNNFYDKERALEKILEKNGCAITEIMAIGDNYNDLSMLQSAKLGIVVANSPMDIQKQIKNVTSSNNNDGVAEAIINYAIC